MFFLHKYVSELNILTEVIIFRCGYYYLRQTGDKTNDINYKAPDL